MLSYSKIEKAKSANHLLACRWKDQALSADMKFNEEYKI